MNIEQILRNATERKTAKILKEERTRAFMDAVPVAIHRGLILDNEIALRNTFLTCGADAYVEKMLKID